MTDEQQPYTGQDVYFRLNNLEQQNDKLYDSMMTLTRSVDAAATHDDLDAIDVTSGWP